MSNSTNATCEPETTKWQHIVLMPLPLLSGVINAFVLLAATIYRKKLLRQNYVYLCVTSTLLSNMLFLSVHLWDEIAAYQLDPAVSTGPPRGKMIILWTLCKSAAISMLFGMCCNLGALIYVLIDSSYFHLASKVSGEPGTSPSHKVSFLGAKKLKAILLVAASWLLPLVLTLMAVTFLNCTTKCHCSHGAAGQLCPTEMGCSRVWEPMHNTYMAINIALWFFEVVGLVFVMNTGIGNYRQFFAGKTPDFPAEKGGVSLPAPPGTCVAAACGESSQSRNVVDRARPKRNWNWFRNNPRLRCVTLLSVIFMLGTVPVVVCFFIDIAGAPINKIGASVSGMVLVQIYTLLCPILLVHYLSNLKNAVVQLVTTLLFCF